MTAPTSKTTRHPPLRRLAAVLALAACALCGPAHGQTLQDLIQGGGSGIIGSSSGSGIIGGIGGIGGTPAPASCGPGMAGAPCGGGGPASQGSGSPVDLGAGNPINLITGNKYQREVDLPALPGVLGLEIVRHYNSAHSGPAIPTGMLGRGWRLSYETVLAVTGRAVQIVQADGTRIIFNRDRKDPSQCASANPAHGKVFIEKTLRGDEYTWIWTDGRKLSFDSGGKLAQIAAPSGEFVSLQYDARGWLIRVTDPQGRSLRLHYLDKKSAAAGDRFRGVQSIDSPAGRFTYGYGSALPQGATLDKAHLLANLVQVAYPKDGGHGVSRVYHYEDPARPTLLTGITVDGAGSDGRAMRQRVATWAYDINGRAVLSVKGEPMRKDRDGKAVAGTGIEQVTLDYSQAGLTVLTNSLGQTTRYRHAIVGGQYRLLEARGPGCAGCGRTNVKYGYDKLGRLTEETTLDAGGRPLRGVRTELDGDGRVLGVGTVGYRDGRPLPAQWRLRYAYAPHRQDDLPGDQPMLMARPSVVPGKEHRVRIAYNAARQPVEIAESGWSPAADGKGEAAPVERVTAYAYRTINGRSVLAEIDGPLKNGPKASPEDSDITRLTWDNKGNMPVLVTAPGNFKSMVKYDALGRIEQVGNDEGFTIALTYNARNQQTSIVANGITQSILYDTLGRPVEVGYVDNATYKPLARLGFDNAGRRIWTASHLGILDSFQFDSEGKLLESATQSAGFKQTQRYAYDAFGRLVASSDAAGAIRRIDWNAQGLPASVSDALGRETRYRYDAQGNPMQVVEAANTGLAHMQDTAIRFERDALGRIQAVVAPNGAATRYVKDDFGRTLAIFRPDSGKATRSYDAANRLIASADAKGNQATYEYDIAGRIVRQVVSDAKAARPDKQRTITTWKYEGRRLVAIEHPEQTERYRHDEQGRLSVKTVSVKLADGSQATSIARYRYDKLGQLQSVSLPDGSTLHYRRNGQDQVVSLEHGLLRTSWLSWLLPSRPIVGDLERDIAGLKSYTYGNGIQAKYQRSKEGLLARIVHRAPKEATSAAPRSAALAPLFAVGSAHAAPSEGAAAAPAGGTDTTGRRAPALPGALGLASDPKAWMDHRYLWDAQGNLLHTQSKDTAHSYAYDAQDRLIAAAAAPRTTPLNAATAAAAYARYFYDTVGNRLLAQEGIADQADLKTGTVKASYMTGNRWQGSLENGDKTVKVRYDETGQPERIGQREYVWDAAGKLLEVRQENRSVARYRYNHQGERIGKATDSGHTYYLYEGRKLTAELNAQGRIVRQYVYLGEQPIAVIDTPAGKPLDVQRSALSQLAADLATVVDAWFSGKESIAYLHNNHLGAPELATDAQGEPVWKAAYSPYGRIVRTDPRPASGRAGDKGFKLNLRLPGQYEDEETGLHYNDHRYYDPARGRYLTPDPLGLRAGINAYAYVKGNPLKYVDPSGLILFAFDGTGNSDPAPTGDSISNVTKFYQAYDEQANGPKFYITGIGTTNEEMPYKGNMANGDGFDQRVDLGFTFLEQFIDANSTDTATVDIDVVGFSRGAAEARVWGNLLAGRLDGGKYTTKAGKSRCLELRFEGLWDTVPHLGYLNGNESKYNFAIPVEVKYAAHAVALNEHRGGLANFDGRSILNTPATSSGSSRIEMGFIGSHADIGGGYGTGDLSDVALMWIIEQSKKQGIQFKQKTIQDNEWDKITNPILHDKSGNKIAPGEAPLFGDRDFIYGDGTTVKQTQAVIGGNDTTWANNFVSYYGVWCGPSGAPAVGLVDMQKYGEWLKGQGVNIGYAMPSSPQPCQ